MHPALRIIAIATLTTLAASAVHAQAGTWVARIGATRIMPNVESGSLSAPTMVNSKIDIDPATALSGGITYFIDDHFAIDVPLSLPFKHDVVGDGAVAGVGKVAEVKALPTTVLARYHFLTPREQVRPYLGAGLTYAKFFKEKTTSVLSALTGGTPSNPTTMEVDPKLGLTVQVGTTVKLTDRISFDAALLKTWLRTTVHLSTGQSIDLKINPLTVSLGVGYRF